MIGNDNNGETHVTHKSPNCTTNERGGNEVHTRIILTGRTNDKVAEEVDERPAITIE